VPGIEISRIDTLDFDDGSLLATCSGKHGYGYGHGAKHSYILLNRSAWRCCKFCDSTPCTSDTSRMMLTPLTGFLDLDPPYTGDDNAKTREYGNTRTRERYLMHTRLQHVVGDENTKTFSKTYTW